MMCKLIGAVGGLHSEMLDIRGELGDQSDAPFLIKEICHFRLDQPSISKSSGVSSSLNLTD